MRIHTCILQFKSALYLAEPGLLRTRLELHGYRNPQYIKGCRKTVSNNRLASIQEIPYNAPLYYEHMTF